MFGFMDESGSPGVANTEEDFLVASLVIFENREAVDKCSASIERLKKRLKLADNYEFHHSRNSNRVRDAFIDLINNLEFRIITISIKKSGWRTHASYQNLAMYLVREIVSRYQNMKILLDSNPILHKELEHHLKAAKSNIVVKMVSSHSDNLVQLADYVVALTSRKLKGSAKAIKQYRPLIKKQLYYSEIN